jgi:hypothetical protein
MPPPWWTSRFALAFLITLNEKDVRQTFASAVVKLASIATEDIFMNRSSEELATVTDCQLVAESKEE